MRVLVTGSRQFLARATVYAELDAIAARLLDDGLGERMVVVHGNAPGADTLANDWCWDRRSGAVPVLAEPHPAKWSKDNPFAGHQRNYKMVRSDIELALAFFSAGAQNRGTRNCVELIKVWAPHIKLKEVWI